MADEETEPTRFEQTKNDLEQVGEKTGVEGLALMVALMDNSQRETESILQGIRDRDAEDAAKVAKHFLNLLDDIAILNETLDSRKLENLVAEYSWLRQSARFVVDKLPKDGSLEDWLDTEIQRPEPLARPWNP